MADVPVSTVVPLVIVFFLLGVILACTLAVFLPALYRLLVGCKDALAAKCDSCRGSISICVSRETKHVIEVDDVMYDKQTTGSYDEINEMKTLSKGQKKMRKKKKTDGNTSVPELDTTQKQHYEDVENPLNKRFSKHNYCIVEVSTKKRLPVKMVTGETVVSDASRVYFVLEPGTDKVTPVFNRQSLDSKSIVAKNDQIYFVLEPTTETDIEDGQTQPYAVNDISIDHHYFILEKTK